MKTKLTFFCILVAVLTSFSQDKSFDIKNYKFPNYKWREFKFDLNTDFYNINNQDNSQILDNLSPDLNIGFLYESLKPKVVDSLNFLISTRGNLVRGDGLFEYDPNFGFDFYFDRKVYLKENKFFLDISNKLRYSYSNFEWRYEKEYGGGSEWLNTTVNYIHMSIGFGFGFGRVEKASNFWQAQYILKKLKKENLLSRELEKEDIFEFANLATKLKNEWYFNSRHKRESDIIALDSFLSMKGLITDQNSLDSKLLSKYWSFGNFQERKSGHELYFGLGPKYLTRLEKIEGKEDNSIYNELTGGLKISFENYKQLNYNWEYNFRIGVMNTTYFSQTIDSNLGYYSRYEGSSFDAYGGIGCGYYPDLRSAVKLSVDYNGYLSPTAVYDEREYSGSWSNRLYMSLTGDYYVLPRFRISVGINLKETWFNDHNFLTKYYNLGLHYSIF